MKTRAELEALFRQKTFAEWNAIFREVDACVEPVAEGDDVLVKCLDVDPSGKIRLSRRAALAEQIELSRT